MVNQDKQISNRWAPKQTKFQVLLLEGHSLIDAYRMAGYPTRGLTVQQIRNRARNVADQPEVIRTMGIATRKAVARANVGAEELIDELICMAMITPQDLIDKNGNPIPVDRLAERANRGVVGMKPKYHEGFLVGYEYLTDRTAAIKLLIELSNSFGLANPGKRVAMGDIKNRIKRYKALES